MWEEAWPCAGGGEAMDGRRCGPAWEEVWPCVEGGVTLCGRRHVHTTASPGFSLSQFSSLYKCGKPILLRCVPTCMCIPMRVYVNGNQRSALSVFLSLSQHYFWR